MLRAEFVLPEIFRCVTRSLINVVPRTASWIWKGWIPRGTLSLVVGEPGVGKSLYVLQLAAMVTRGWRAVPMSQGLTDAMAPATGQAATGNAQPSGSQVDASLAATQSSPAQAIPANIDDANDTGAVGTVVLFDCGDSPSILRSRLDAAGADIERIVLVERNWRGDPADEVEEFLEPAALQPSRRPARVDSERELRRDLQSLELHVVQLKQAGHDVSLVIIDPIESLLREARDKYRLARSLSELAERLNVAIVAVGTTTSKLRNYPGLRLDGKGIDALFKESKTVVSIVRDVNDERQRLVRPTKLNLSATPPGLTFAFGDDGALQWSQTATSVVDREDGAQPDQAPKTSVPREVVSELSRAMTWLKERLSEGGVPVTTVRSDAAQQGISRASLRRAYDQLDCVSKKSSGSGHWVWRLPGSMDDAGASEPADIATQTESESCGPMERANEACATPAS